MNAPNPAAHELMVRRMLPAPPRVVYRVWTDPEYARRWGWGHRDSTISMSIDCRVGGVWRHQIRAIETGEIWSFEGEFREVVPNARLVHTFRWTSDRGADHGTSLVSIDFVDRGEETEVVITHTQLRDAQLRDGTEKGWGRVIDTIAEFVGDANHTRTAREGGG